MRRAATRLGPSFSCGSYDGWAAGQAEAAVTRGQLLAIPGSRLITRKFGTFAAALVAAELIDVPDSLRRGGKPYAREQLLQALGAAIAHRGANLTRSDYRRWRQAQLRPLLAVDPRARLVNDVTICERLGGGDWARARREALRATAVATQDSPRP